MYKIYQELLDKKGLKNSDIARETGISNMTLSDWKNGKSTPKYDKLILIANYFGVSVEYLRTGKEPQMDYLYTNENAEFLIEVTKMAKNQDFVKRMQKYMELVNDNRKSVDDMIDFMYEKQKKDEN